MDMAFLRFPLLPQRSGQLQPLPLWRTGRGQLGCRRARGCKSFQRRVAAQRPTFGPGWAARFAAEEHARDFGPVAADLSLEPPFAATVQALHEGQSVVVSAPTGSGKTVIGELAVYMAMAPSVAISRATHTWCAKVDMTVVMPGGRST